MKRPLLFVSICLSLIIAVWTSCVDAPPFYSPLTVKDGEQIIALGQVYQKESRSYYGAEQTNLYLKSIKYLDSSTGQVQTLNPKFKIICEYRELDKVVCLGEIVEISGTWKEYVHAANPGQFDSADHYAVQNIVGKVKAEKLTVTGGRVQQFREKLHQCKIWLLGRLYQYLPEKEAGILAKMLLGDGSGLDEEVKDLYQRNGIIHILSISGLHITIIGMGIYRLLRKCTCPIWPAAVIGGGVLLVYGAMTGFGISACRAIGMYLIRMLGEVLGRDYDLLTALGVLMTGMLFGNSRLIFHSGFLLSFASVAAVGILCPYFQFDEKSFRKYEPLPIWLQFMIRYFGRSIQGLWTSMAISIFTLPILLYFFYEVPVYASLLNLLVLPFLGVLVMAGIALLLLPGTMLWAAVIHIILNGYERICQMFECLPGHTWVVGRPQLWQVGLYYGGLIVLLWISRKKRYYLAGVLVLVFLLGIKRENGTQVTFLDVGQGDCIVIVDGRNTIMIDGGSSTKKEIGENIVEPFLKYHGINKVDGVFLTHSDKDHMNGILEILEKDLIKVDTIYLPEVKERDEYAEILTLVEEENVVYYGKGDMLKTENLQMECLHPVKETALSDNESSGCFLLEADGCRVLLTGDVEGRGEELLAESLENIGIREIQVLKVSHHGSRNATSEDLLRRIDPILAVISCGENNSYGHPHKELIERLKGYTAHIYATKDKGSVTVYTKDQKVVFFRKGAE